MENKSEDIKTKDQMKNNALDIEADKFKQCNVLQKIQWVKYKLLEKNIQKTGKNTYSNYSYYQLADIEPPIVELCTKVGLFTKFTFFADKAVLQIIDMIKHNDTDNDKLEYLYSQTYESPMKDVEIKGANQIQCLGGIETYQRRYLYMAAFDISENDMFDDKKSKNSASTNSRTEQDDFISKCNIAIAKLPKEKKQMAITFLTTHKYKSIMELNATTNLKDKEDFLKLIEE